MPHPGADTAHRGALPALESTIVPNAGPAEGILCIGRDGRPPRGDPGARLLVAGRTATMVRSVVATGKVEPITKVEVKSKANGIIERLLVDVGDVNHETSHCT